MQEESPSEPLNRIIRQLRRPATFRELIAACLRSIYMGDELSGDKTVIPPLPQILLDEVTVSEALISGVRCSVYAPRNSYSNLPALIYMHGGGFVIGSSEDTDYITRRICHSSKMIVVSVNYRLAPETVFPGALDDCERVLIALIAGEHKLELDTNCVFVGGDSAGGNLALALCQRMKGPSSPIKGVVLLAPWLDMNLEQYSSFNRLAPEGIVMDAAFLAYSRAAYVGFEEWKNFLVSPLLSNLGDLPPTLCIVGTGDPFVDQITAFEAKANSSHCRQIEVLTFEGMPHCFYSFTNVFYEEVICYKKITDFITRVRAIASKSAGI